MNYVSTIFLILAVMTTGVVFEENIGSETSVITKLSERADLLTTGTENGGLTNTEQRNRHDPDQLQRKNKTAGIQQTTEILNNPLSDIDNDNLDNVQEIQNYGTSPVNPDTDGDGLTDGEEVKHLDTDPTKPDTDNDGLDDGKEISVGTNPTIPDTDSDNLTDAEEVLRYETNPTQADTDDDSITDSREIFERQTDPTQADTDNDSLDDDVEKDYGTNPTSPDTDRDGLKDGHEITNETNPLERDTDNDRLIDGREMDIGSSPTVRDTDSDGFLDGVEVKSSKIQTASPTRKDVFLELDSTTGAQLTGDEIQRLKQAFRNSPTEQAIKLHIQRDDTMLPESESVGILDYFDGYYEDDFDNRGNGYYHLLIVNEVDDLNKDSDVTGLARGYTDGMVVQQQDNGGTGAAAFHEIGHQLGLNSEDFRGIDSTEVSGENYPSTMNYNYHDDNRYSYAGGNNTSTEFDDWNHINKYLDREQANHEYLVKPAT